MPTLVTWSSRRNRSGGLRCPYDRSSSGIKSFKTSNPCLITSTTWVFLVSCAFVFDRVAITFCTFDFRLNIKSGKKPKERRPGTIKMPSSTCYSPRSKNISIIILKIYKRYVSIVAVFLHGFFSTSIDCVLFTDHASAHSLFERNFKGSLQLQFKKST